MLSLQPILEIKIYKSVWIIFHKIRKSLASPYANFQLSIFI